MTESEAIEYTEKFCNIARKLFRDNAIVENEKKITITPGGATVSTPNSEETFEDVSDAIKRFCR